MAAPKDVQVKKRSRAISLSLDWENIVKEEGEPSVKVAGRTFGAIEVERPMVEFPTGSSYTGRWNALGMAGLGTYVYPYGVEYEGGMEDGMFQGNGTLIYPMGQKLEGVWDKGRMVSYTFFNVDGLECTDPWKYCRMPDRRFNVERREGLQPAGREFLTNQQPTRVIPDNCYDTGDGFYNAQAKCLVRARDPQEMEDMEECRESDEWIHAITIVDDEQGEWIQRHCRKAWDEPVGCRPEFYEDWITGREMELEQLDWKYQSSSIIISEELSDKTMVESQKDKDSDEEGEFVIEYAGTGRKLILQQVKKGKTYQAHETEKQEGKQEQEVDPDLVDAY